MSNRPVSQGRLPDHFFRLVADYTYDWESWHGPQGELIWVNAAVERMTGYTVEQCMRMADYPLPIVAEQDRPKIEHMLAAAVTQNSFNDLEFQILTRAGETRWMAVSWQPMYDRSQAYHGFRTSVRDITERYRLKEQLKEYAEHLEQLVEQRTERIAQLEHHRQQMEKLAALGELAAGVAHEVNNPLAGIRNAFALFRDSLPTDHEHFELLDLVDKEIERISSIIHQMYQLYRRSPQQAREFTIQHLLEEVLCLLSPIADRYHVKLETMHEDQPIKVALPEGELKQIGFNLIRNAIQASESGQTVRVIVESEPERVVLKVIDEGCGMDQATLEHIFEPFFSTKGELKEGMGLGLSVTHNLIKGMDGEIDVVSEQGVGSCFTVTLPKRLHRE